MSEIWCVQCSSELADLPPSSTYGLLAKFRWLGFPLTHRVLVFQRFWEMFSMLSLRVWGCEWDKHLGLCATEVIQQVQSRGPTWLIPIAINSLSKLRLSWTHTSQPATTWPRHTTPSPQSIPLWNNNNLWIKFGEGLRIDYPQLIAYPDPPRYNQLCCSKWEWL